MVATRMASFLEQLRSFEVLTPVQLKEVQGASLAQAEDPVPLAKALLSKGWLTAFQANLLLKNKGDELILGAYRLQEPVGQGGMGTVFRASTRRWTAWWHSRSSRRTSSPIHWRCSASTRKSVPPPS